MVTVLKIILVTVLLASMVLVLVMIRYFMHPAATSGSNASDRLRHDVATRDRVVTSNSLFHQFFARPDSRKAGK